MRFSLDSFSTPQPPKSGLSRRHGALSPKRRADARSERRRTSNSVRWKIKIVSNVERRVIMIIEAIKYQFENSNSILLRDS